MSNTLLIPINLDALCLESSQEVLDTMADYSKLPYKYQGETHGSGQANLSEQILAPLFNHQLSLEAGIHLHWSIPDGLTMGQHEIETTFPQVPNRTSKTNLLGGIVSDSEDKTSTFILSSIPSY